MKLSENAGNMLASACAGASSSVLFHPLDVLRVRWQQARMQKNSSDKGGATLLKFSVDIAKREGFVGGLARPALGVQILLAFVTMGAKWGCYPMVRDTLSTVSNRQH